MAKYLNKSFIINISFLCSSLIFLSCSDKNKTVINNNTVILAPSKYPMHTDITATLFWVGELGNSTNGFIPNDVSAWDGKWKIHFGGIDTPNNRAGFYPAAFIPKENPFYFALPYNDIDNNGDRKQSAFTTVFWANEKTWRNDESMCKNTWIQIVNGNKVAFAQWEDVGPFESDDSQYVFGTADPLNKINDAGLDLSPAVTDFLGLSGLNKVSWQFVEFKDVPDGPWKDIITTSQIR